MRISFLGTSKLTLMIAIQAPVQAPAVHPHDRPLLRPIAALGKPKVAEANVSFLRRTEYISSMVPKRLETSSPRALLTKARRPAQKAGEQVADSPQVIKRKIDRGFDIAEQDLKDAKRLKHPTKKHLKVVEAMPFLPDLDAFPDSGAYVTIKFLTNPMSAGNKYDTRMLSGLFRPIDKTETEEASYEAALAAYERDPVNNNKPQNLMNYDYYLGRKSDDSNNFQRMFDVEDPDHDNTALYTDQSTECFQFNRIRGYETAQETELDHPSKYQDEVLLAYNDDDSLPRQKAMYYYPVMQKSTIRPQRTKNIARTVGIQDEKEQIVDQLDISVDDPTEEMRDAMKRYKEHPLGWDQEPEEELQEVDAEGDDEPEQRDDTPPRRRRSPSEDDDAEGDEDED